MHLAQSVSSRGSKKPVCISWQSWHDVFRWGLGLRSNNLGVESNQAITLLLRFWAKDSLCFNIWGPSEILRRDLYKIFQSPWRWTFSMGVSGINWKTRKFTAFSTTNVFRCVRRWEADLLPKMRVGEHQGGNACFCSMLLWHLGFVVPNQRHRQLCIFAIPMNTARHFWQTMAAIPHISCTRRWCLGGCCHELLNFLTIPLEPVTIIQQANLP